MNFLNICMLTNQYQVMYNFQIMYNDHAANHLFEHWNLKASSYTLLQRYSFLWALKSLIISSENLECTQLLPTQLDSLLFLANIEGTTSTPCAWARLNNIQMLFTSDKYTTRQPWFSIKRQKENFIYTIPSTQPQSNFNLKRTNTPGFQFATWKSPKSSSGISCKLSLSWVGNSFDSVSSETDDLSSECSSRLRLDGESAGELEEDTEGESGASGGGGGLRQTTGSFPFPFSSREILFKPCSKNLDRMLPPPFCQQDQWKHIKMTDQGTSCHSSK